MYPHLIFHHLSLSSSKTRTNDRDRSHPLLQKKALRYKPLSLSWNSRACHTPQSNSHICVQRNSLEEPTEILFVTTCTVLHSLIHQLTKSTTELTPQLESESELLFQRVESHLPNLLESNPIQSYPICCKR